MKITECVIIFFALLLSVKSFASQGCVKSRISFITDSHGVGPFGDNMDRWLLTFSDFELHTYALGGSSPFWFLRGENGFTTPWAFFYNSCSDGAYPSISQRRGISAKSQDIKKMLAYDHSHPFNRDLVIFEQGSNVPGENSVYKNQARDLALATRRASPDSVCFWISAPRMIKISDAQMAEVNTFINQGLIEAEVILKKEFPENKNPACYFINSQKYGSYPTNFPAALDGVHYPFPWTCSADEAARHLPKCTDYTLPWVNGIKSEMIQILKSL